MLAANSGYIWATYCPLQRFCSQSLTERGIARDDPRVAYFGHQGWVYTTLSVIQKPILCRPLPLKKFGIGRGTFSTDWGVSRDSCGERNANQSCPRSGYGMLHRNPSLGRKAVEDSWLSVTMRDNTWALRYCKQASKQSGPGQIVGGLEVRRVAACWLSVKYNFSPILRETCKTR